MSEQAPRVIPEVINNNPEGLPPRDETIDTVRNEMNTLEAEINDAEEKVRTPGFRADANDIIENRENLRNVRETSVPRLEGLQGMWTEYGGEDIDQAQADARLLEVQQEEAREAAQARIEEAETAVAALNFKSDANDRVAAQTELRDANEAARTLDTEQAEQRTIAQEHIEEAKDNFYAQLEESMQEDDPLDTEPEDDSEENDPLDTNPEDDDELDNEPEDDDDLDNEPEDDLFDQDEDTRPAKKATSKEWDDAKKIDDDFNADPVAVAKHARVHAAAEAAAAAAADIDDEPEDDDNEREPSDDEDLDDGYDDLSPEERAAVNNEAYARMTPAERAALDAEVKADLDAEEEANRGRFSRLYRNQLARITMIYTGNGPRPSTLDRIRGSRKSTKIAMGAACILLAATAGYAAWKFGLFSGGHDNSSATPDPVVSSKPSSVVDNNFNIPNTHPGDTSSVDTNSLPDFTPSPDAMHVEAGEGWFQTLKELGITDTDTQKAILNNDTIMGKLQDMGLAYKAPDLGGWGLNMPPNGQMPKEALDLVNQARESIR